MNSTISNTNLYKEIAMSKLYATLHAVMTKAMQMTQCNNWSLRITAANLYQKAAQHDMNRIDIEMVRHWLCTNPIYPPRAESYAPLEVALFVLHNVKANQATQEQVEDTLYMIERAGMTPDTIVLGEIIKWRGMNKVHLADYMATTHNSNIANKRLTQADIEWRQYERDEEWYWHVEDMQRATERLLVEPYQGPSDEWGIYDVGDLPRLRMLDMELCHELANMDNARIDKYLAN